MSLRVDPALANELKEFGGGTVSRCFNCGNCTAACQLTNQDAVFPRRYIRYIQLGLREKMLGSVDPWLCFYCGDCSETCPREADPGNLMMASRRWLIAAYDWTGLSRLMYRSVRWELVLLFAVAAAVLAWFSLTPGFGFRLLAAHPEARQTVMLQCFAPKDVIHQADVALASVLAALLLSNAARMLYYARKHCQPAPASAWLAALGEFVIQGLTQKRWRQCASGASRHWLRHLLLVFAYGTMFLLVVVFLKWFQVEDASFHWTSLPGYAATLVLLAATLSIMADRRRKRDPIHRHSDVSDWLFVILLFLTSLSGILLHAARILDLPMPAYALYVVHLMIAVPMLVVEVPFGKWSHLLYRPLALYLAEVERRAQRARAAAPAPLAPQPAWGR
ncbi:MAG: 4Fe-4S dicluster domain-containing protein [Bryobacteraceae bacterium]|nr:4Fe-4S dicluster domain-containing protein [Bryobacteraceae bacterium]